MDAAVAAARKAFQTTWGTKVSGKHIILCDGKNPLNKASGTERGALIYKLADLMERDQQLLAELESLDNGKPVRIARYYIFDIMETVLNIQRDGDIADSIACLRYYAGWADKLTGQVRITTRRMSYMLTLSRLSETTLQQNLRILERNRLGSAAKCDSGFC